MQISQAPRVTWLDTARGMTILLVVAFHAMRGLGNENVATPLVQINYLLGAARMPAFFLVSGMLTAYGIGRAWPQFFARRLAPSLWLFVLWSLLLILASHVLAWPNELLPISHLLTMWVDPYLHLWFIHDLIVMAILARLTLSVPSAILLPIAAGYYLAWNFGILDPDAQVPLFVFFIAGVRFQNGLLTLPARAPLSILVFGTLASLGLAATIGIEETKPLIACAGIAALLSGAVLLDRWAPTGTVLTAIGSHSLGIYLLHMILIGYLMEVVPDRPIAGGWPMLFLLTIFAVLGSMAIQRICERLGLTWLFALPRRRSREGATG